MKKPLLLLLFVFLIQLGNAQDTESVEYVENTFKGTRFINGQSANLAEKGKLHLLVQHRFGAIDGGLYELFGLDQASMRIGFEYGLGNNINVGFGRASFLKTYDVYGKARLVRQSANFPLSIVFTAAGSVPTLCNYFPSEMNNFADKLSANFQVHLAKRIGVVGLQVTPGYLSTGYLLPEDQKFSLFILGLAGSVRLSDNLSLNLEYLNHFESELSGQKPLSLGIDIETRGHLFQLMISNSQRMFTNGLYTSTTGDWSEGNIFFGFNLIREFTLKYY
jgi:hypothetical protein